MKCGHKLIIKIITSFSLIILSHICLSVRPPYGVVSIAPDTLKRISQDLRNGEYGKISGIVILSKSRVIFEQYYDFTDANTLHPISSVTKSITSLIAGICLDKGYIRSIDEPIWKFFPEYRTVFEKDSTKKKITIRNLLNQTTGIKWDEWTTHYSYAGNELMEMSQGNQNWVESTLKIDLDSKPGTKFCYNSFNSQIIEAILCKSTHKDFESLVTQYLFNPLGIKQYHWDLYPNNGVPAWGGLSLTTRDMARFGNLICNYGCWNDLQLVSSDWIEKSIQKEPGNNKVEYGLHWWLGTQPDGNPLVYAAGYGDRYIYVAPDKKIVIAINGQNFTDYKWPKDIDSLVKSILSSVQ